MKLAVAIVLFASVTAVADEVAPPMQERAVRAPGPRRPMPPTNPVQVASPEVAKLGKQMAGTYKCKGVQLVGDGSSTPFEATVTIKMDLDDAWIQATLASAQVKWTEYRTFDAVAKQWTRIQVASNAAHTVMTSLGEQNGTWNWEGTATSSAGTTQMRDHEQLAKDHFKVWGEALASGSWQKQYEATCKR